MQMNYYDQVVTEKHLYSEGQKLEKDLHSRNNDITRLLSKIDALALSDQAKSAQCYQFVNELQDNQRKLLSQVEVAKLATRQDIDALIQSNHDLLSTSQDTYSKLQSVVSTCLSKVHTYIFIHTNAFYCRDFKIVIRAT